MSVENIVAVGYGDADTLNLVIVTPLSAEPWRSIAITRKQAAELAIVLRALVRDAPAPTPPWREKEPV